MASRSFRQNCLSSGCEPICFATRKEMGLVHQSNQPDKFMRHRTNIARNLYRREFKAHFGCVNAIEFSHKGGELMASGIVNVITSFLFWLNIYWYCVYVPPFVGEPVVPLQIMFSQSIPVTVSLCFQPI